MIIRILGFVLITIILYIINVKMAVWNRKKYEIKINKYIKIILGFWAYKEERFSLSSIIMQTMLIAGVITYIIILVYSNNIDYAMLIYSYFYIIGLIMSAVVIIIIDIVNWLRHH